MRKDIEKMEQLQKHQAMTVEDMVKEMHYKDMFIKSLLNDQAITRLAEIYKINISKPITGGTNGERKHA